MAHFAKVLNSIVVHVIVAEPEFFDTFIDSSPGEWYQTSYNTRGNIHYGQDGLPDGGTPLRGNFAGLGYEYNKEHDVFYPPRPYPSWVMNESIWTWEPPTPHPNDGKGYYWSEPELMWVEVVPLI